jgi:ribosomal protein S18 acetylase RimI-like enzyme
VANDSEPPELLRRPITDDDHGAWAQRFTCGDDPWCSEVDHFLKGSAWDWQQLGQCNTSLFSIPGSDEVVGYFAIAADRMARQGAETVLGAAFPLANVPCCKIAYFGVSRDHQHVGIGQDMWAHLLLQLHESALSPRVVVLEVRETNESAMAFWTGLGFGRYGQPFRPKGEDESSPVLIRLLFDRYSGS